MGKPVISDEAEIAFLFCFFLCEKQNNKKTVSSSSVTLFFSLAGTSQGYRRDENKQGTESWNL